VVIKLNSKTLDNTLLIQVQDHDGSKNAIKRQLVDGKMEMERALNSVT
jgi:hypothetical protein